MSSASCSRVRLRRWAVPTVLALVLVPPPLGAQEDAEEGEPAPVAVDEGPPGAGRRITFELPFPAAKGGGSARGSAATLEYLREDYVVARGGVELLYQDKRFQGDRVEVDLATKIVTARGHVVLDHGPRRITGETLVYDLESETGKFTEAHAFVDPDIYFRGAEIEKISDELYTMTDGVVTSCSGDVPAWSFRAGKSKVRLGGYAQVRNATMRVKKLPILYAPYLAYPTEQERQSGLLFPNVGYSDRRGYLLGLGYYQTFGDSFDATLMADIYSEDFFGVGTEVRYAPTAGTSGILDGFAIDDPEFGETRWKATLRHTSNDLPWNLRGVIKATRISDFDFFRDYERDFNQISLRRVGSTGYLSGSWGSHSFNFVVEELETFVRNDITQTQRQLPEVEYVLRPTRLGPLPAYLELSSSAHYFQSERTGTEQFTWGRADLAPRLTVPLSYWPWLSVKLGAGGRMTYYDDSLTDDRTDFRGEALTRTYPIGDLSIIGPSFSRIFEKRIGGFAKFKHIIEPRITYSYIGDPGEEDQSRVPIFDQIDPVQERNIVTYALVNRVLAKPAGDDLTAGAYEIFSFELSQALSLNDEQPFQVSRDRTEESRYSKIGSRLRFSPSRSTNFEARATYSTLFSVLDTASLSGGTQVGPHSFGVTWNVRKDPELDTTTSHQGRLFTSFELVPARLRLSSQVNYDFVQGLLQHHRHTLQFFGQCFGVSLEFRELRNIRRNLEEIRDREFRLSISLKNIGTFIDLNGGSSEGNY